MIQLITLERNKQNISHNRFSIIEKIVLRRRPRIEKNKIEDEEEYRFAEDEDDCYDLKVHSKSLVKIQKNVNL